MHLYLFLPISWQSFETFWTFLRKSFFFAEKSLREYPRTSLWFEVAELTTFEETKMKKKHFLSDNNLLLRIMNLYRCLLNSGETGKQRDYDPLPVGCPTELPHDICIIQAINYSPDDCARQKQSQEKNLHLLIKFLVDQSSTQEKSADSKSGQKLYKSPRCSISSAFWELGEAFSSISTRSSLKVQRKTRKPQNQNNQEKLKFCSFRVSRCWSSSKQQQRIFALKFKSFEKT